MVVTILRYLLLKVLEAPPLKHLPLPLRWEDGGGWNGEGGRGCGPPGGGIDTLG